MSRSFRNLDQATRRSLLHLLDRCLDYLQTGQTLTVEDVKALLPARTDDSDNERGEQKAGAIFYESVRAMIAYLASIADMEQQRRVREITELICRAAQSSFGEYLNGWRVSLHSISKIRQTYWDSLRAREIPELIPNDVGRVVRINDIPFAEAIFPALLSSETRNGLSVVIEDVEWPDVGRALASGRIDVAIYPTQIREQLRNVSVERRRGSLYRSAPLLAYRDYPVIRNTGAVVEPSKLAYPRGSDFGNVIRDNSVQGSLSLVSGNGSTFDVTLDKFLYRSADEVMARVVDGRVEYGLVGGLQAHYATRHHGSGTNLGLPFTIEVYTQLNLKRANSAYFWTMAQCQEEADYIINLMIDQWNELFVMNWPDLGAEGLQVPANIRKSREKLLTIVNCQSHWSFVDDFADLRTLINEHDANLENRVNHGARFVHID